MSNDISARSNLLSNIDKLHTTELGIHSDATGEISNFRWPNEIYSGTYGSYYDYGVDGAAKPDSYGDKAVDYYENPR